METNELILKYQNYLQQLPEGTQQEMQDKRMLLQSLVDFIETQREIDEKSQDYSLD